MPMHSKPIDALTGVKVTDDFERFDQQFEIYCRSIWDSSISSDKAKAFFDGYYMPHAKARKVDGFSLKDYALRNAAWHVSNVLRDVQVAGEFRKNTAHEKRKEGFWDPYSSHDEGWPEPLPITDPTAATEEIKRVAQFFGAGEVGIGEFDERWLYSRIFSSEAADGEYTKPQEIPGDMTHVVVTAEPMDTDLISTVPSALSGAATGLGYTYDSIVVILITQYIRNLGYRAYGTLNDSSLGIPVALQAGLGEVGRNGLLINKAYGPRFRIGKIYTDMPLVPDKPVKLGVKEFCEQCDRCAKACPPQAIPYGPPSAATHSVSNIKGVVKWTPNAEKCFGFWANQNTDCIICVRACPFNRDFSLLRNRLWLRLAGGSLRKLALWLDDRFVDRGRKKVRWWWQKAKTNKEHVLKRF
ncbi:MAG: reductive dehalogenase domain-containing protein [Pseudomonadota bacterium]